MDWVRLVLDYIDVLAWPLSGMGLVVFLLRFRENIALLIDRIQGGNGPSARSYKLTVFLDYGAAEAVAHQRLLELQTQLQTNSLRQARPRSHSQSQ